MEKPSVDQWGFDDDVEVRGLFVAGRGTGPGDGLHRYEYRDDQWHGKHLATVADLAALAQHPSLPVIYGVGGAAGHGEIHAWDVSNGGARGLGVLESKGVEPCHVAVDPSGGLLVVAHYVSGTLAVQQLAGDGSFEGELELIVLTGTSVDPDRQESAHPHQVVFEGSQMFVIDLGSDLVRRYDVARDSSGRAFLLPAGDDPVPPGTGPRHAVILPDGRLVLNGELASTVLTGGDSDAQVWSTAASTLCTGPAQTRSERNYPGDLQRSDDGALVMCANRGYDTVSTFAVEGESLRLVSETDTGVAWPQHLLVGDQELLIAGWDSSAVASMPLVDGIPARARVLFECANPVWLLPLIR